MSLPRPFSPIQSLPFNDGLVLFWPAGDRLWVLNETATFIWNLLSADMELTTAVVDFATAFSIPTDLARSGIEDSLAGFSAEGLLEGGCPQKLPSYAEDWGLSAAGTALQEPDCWVFAEQFVLAGQNFSFCSEDRLLAEQFVEMLQPLINVSTNNNAPNILLALTRNEAAEDSWNIYSAGRLCFSGLEYQAVLPSLMTLIFIRTCEELDQFMLFHAAVMVRNGKALLLPAQAGSGKTTLAAALAMRGWTCFSDELAPIDPQTRQVFSLLLPMSIKPGSVQALQQSYPDLAGLSVWNRVDGQKVRYLLPPEMSFPEKSQSAVVHKIVFPLYQEQGETTLEPLEKSAALQCLSQTGSSNRPLREQDVRAMISLIEDADCYQLQHSDNSAAIELLESLFGEG